MNAYLRDSDLINGSDLARVFGVAESAILSQKDKLPGVIIAGNKMYRLNAIKAMLDNGKITFAPQKKVDAKPAPIFKPAKPIQNPVKTDALPRVYECRHIYPTKQELATELGTTIEKLDSYIAKCLLPVKEHVGGIPRYDDLKIKDMLKSGKLDLRYYPDEVRRDSKHIRRDVYRQD